MKISEKQLVLLVRILEHACKFYGSFADIERDTLIKLYTKIINQQSDELVEAK